MSKKTPTDELQRQIGRLKEDLARLEDLNRQLAGELDTCRQALAESSGDLEKYREVFWNSPYEAIIVDHQGRVTDVNKRRREAGEIRPGDRCPRIGDRMYTSDFEGNHTIDMRQELMACIASGLPREFPDLGYKDRFMSVKMAPYAKGAIITVTDVTRLVRSERDRQKFESQLLQSQKMEAVGTLAGGIAHDFNNILWIITGNVELIKTEIDPDNDRVHYHIQRIEGASRRAKDLVTQVLAFIPGKAPAENQHHCAGFPEAPAAHAARDHRDQTEYRRRRHDHTGRVTGVQTCALPILYQRGSRHARIRRNTRYQPVANRPG